MIQPHAFMQIPHRDRKRSEVAWSPAEDALLKQLVVRYLTNWRLIADSFNSSRLTISTERRSPLECQTRWRLRWSPGNRHLATGPSDSHQTPPLTDQSPNISSTAPSQMTTRGIRRLATTNLPSIPSPLSGNPVSTESKKRRKHNLVGEVMRRSSKKRELMAKAIRELSTPSICLNY